MKYNPSCAMGGTAIELLSHKTEEARDAVSAALSAFDEIVPNGRDYNGVDYDGAMIEFRKLHNALVKVRDSIDKRLEYLADKRDEREAQRTNHIKANEIGG